jgi:3-hydroxyacyl-CoA dehydrogenase/enoyl-CoA hydratase/3-hydroxybutyryl-CoA epimerase
MPQAEVEQFVSIEKQDNVAFVWFDQQGEDVNKLGPGVVPVFKEVFEELNHDKNVKAVVLISNKKDFIAGADIEYFLSMTEPGVAEQFIREGQELLNQIATSRKPVVAALHGASMGGGLEVALACHGRIASTDKSTKFAMPEVQLGLMPSAGGAQRLPRLVGLQNGLDMLLTGKNIFVPKAKKMGLIDRTIHTPGLKRAAREFAQELIGKPIIRQSKQPLSARLFENNIVTRNFILTAAEHKVWDQTKGNYPAPFKIIDTVETGLRKGIDEGLKKEAKGNDELMRSPQGKQLMRIFLAMTEMKKNPLKEQAKDVQTIGMLGAGFMGAGIAQVSVTNDIEVLLKDVDEDTIASAKKSIWDDFQRKVKKKAMRPAESEELITRVNSELDYDRFGKADLVIEAVNEDINLKQKILKETEDNTREDAIFASNTSALPIKRIAENAQRPSQVIGMHYFSPVPKMPLLEIIVQDNTDKWVEATALELGIRQDKTCIVVKDGPGFYTSRILAPFLNEALLLLEDGVDIEQLDHSMKRFGYPVGPIALLDEVGIDVAAHVMSGELMDYYRQRKGARPSEVLPKLHEAGYSGRKNQKGFYKYDASGKKRKGLINQKIYEFFGNPVKKAYVEEEIQYRLALQMVNEAAMCLEEGIVQSARDGDIGAVFGLGFPPFLGGPFRYLDSLTCQRAVEIMEDLKKRAGERFEPANIIREKAIKGEQFHDDYPG